MVEIENIGRKLIGFFGGLIIGYFIDTILIELFEKMGKPEFFGWYSLISIPLVLSLIGAFHEEIHELLKDIPRIT